jgi:hypothetical protein
MDCEHNHYNLELSRPILYSNCLIIPVVQIWRSAMTKQNVKAKTKSLRGIQNCRVVEVGIGNFVECAKWGPVNCSHAMPFGYCFLCLHPRVEEILENTKKALLAEKLSV